MLFRLDLHDPIMRGEITRTYRNWTRPHARPGARHRLNAHGAIEIVAVEQVPVVRIEDGDARRAGYRDRAALMANLRAAATRVFLVEFRFVREADPRATLARSVAMSDAEVEAIASRLDGMDTRSTRGPWTRATLQLIATHPRILS
jgi:hypothetical protein